MIDPTITGWPPPQAAARSRGPWRKIGQFSAVLGTALVLMTGTALAFELSVDRDPTSIEAPGDEVTYTVTIECDQDPCVVSTLTDSTGNLLGAGNPCGGINPTFTVADPYECSYARDITGTAGTVNTNEVSATGTEAGNAEDDNDTTSVAIVAPSTTPPPTTPPTQDPTPAQIRARVNAKIDAAFQRLGLPSRREIFGDALRAEIRDRLNDRID